MLAVAPQFDFVFRLPAVVAAVLAEFAVLVDPALAGGVGALGGNVSHEAPPLAPYALDAAVASRCRIEGASGFRVPGFRGSGFRVRTARAR